MTGTTIYTRAKDGSGRTSGKQPSKTAGKHYLFEIDFTAEGQLIGDLRSLVTPEFVKRVEMASRRRLNGVATCFAGDLRSSLLLYLRH